MAQNKQIYNVKNDKIDEFYTEYSEIKKEINAHIEYNLDVFRKKIVLLSYDDLEWSNFTRYFAQNFENFREKLIYTSYTLSNKKEKY